MFIFHHHPDGLIYLRKTEIGDICFTVPEFEALLGEPYVGLPEGCRERFYDPETGKNVLFTTAGDQIDGGDFPSVVQSYLTNHPDFIGRVLRAAQPAAA